MCDDGLSCPFIPSDCKLSRVARNPCCFELCSASSWRHSNGLARFLGDNFTRSLLGWDDTPTKSSTLPVRAVALARSNSTTSLPPIRPILTIKPSPLPEFLSYNYAGGHWEIPPDLAHSQPIAGNGSYEAVIIGLTLLIICLLVIAVIFVLAVFRLRSLRYVGPSRSDENTQRQTSGTHHIQVAYIAPPPAYEIIKPVDDLPPTYEQSTSTESENPSLLSVPVTTASNNASSQEEPDST